MDKEKRAIDRIKIASEMNLSGMNIKEVSKELGIPYGTVYGWLRKSKTDNNDSGQNADRHLCRTCQYRAGSHDRNNAGINCDYCDLMKRSRGCKAKECTVYVKGPRLKPKKRSVRLKKERHEDGI